MLELEPKESAMRRASSTAPAPGGACDRSKTNTFVSPSRCGEIYIHTVKSPIFSAGV